MSSEDPDAPDVYHARYQTIKNVIHNLNAPSRSHVAFQKCRFWSADKWAALDPSEVPGIHPCTGAGGTANNAMRTDPATLAVVDAAINQLQQDAGAGTGASGHLIRHKHHIDFVGNTFKEMLAGVAVGNDTKNHQHVCPGTTEDFGNWSNFDETWVNKQGKMIAEEMKMLQEKLINLSPT